MVLAAVGDSARFFLSFRYPARRNGAFWVLLPGEKKSRWRRTPKEGDSDNSEEEAKNLHPLFLTGKLGQFIEDPVVACDEVIECGRIHFPL